MIASAGSRPTAWAAASSRYGAGLPIETGTTPVAASSGDDDRAGAGSQAALGRVDRVAVGGDEAGARPDAVGGDRRAAGRSGSGRARRRPRRGRRRRRSRRSPPGSSGSRRRPRSRRRSPTSRSSRSSPLAAEDQHAPDARARGRAGRAPSRARTTRPVSGVTGAAHRREPGLVVGPVVHRVVGHVDDVVAAGRAIGKDRGDARDGIGAAIDDAVEVDEQEEAHGPDRSRAPRRRVRLARCRSPIARPAGRHRPAAGRWHEPAPCHVEDGGRAAPPAALIGRLRGAIPAATTIELVFDGPPERGLRNERIAAGVDRPLQRRAHRRRRSSSLMIDDVGLLDGADGTAAAPGRHRRPRPAPRRAAARRPDGRLGVAARPARGRSARVAVGRQPATGAHLAADAVRSRAVVLADPSSDGDPAEMDRRRLEDRTRRDDQEGQPAEGAQGGWDW